MKNTQSEIDIVKLEARADAFAERMKNLEIRQEKLETRQEILEAKQTAIEKREDLLDLKLKPFFSVTNIALGILVSTASVAFIYLIATQIAKG